ncbi:hypothetical protein M378DRAFT_28930, partial [Amanita muscaria Koide BX008]
DFDESYEILLSFAAAIRETSHAPLRKMSYLLETATYKDWATPDSDNGCPICVDDVRS